MKKLVRLVCYGNVQSIVHFVVMDAALRSRVVIDLIKLMKDELRQLSSDRYHSLLREKSQTAMEYFSWSSVWSEVSVHAPVFVALLLEVTSKLSSNPEQANASYVCVCVALLLKLRNPKMHPVQAMISLLMHIGHSSKQVTIIINVWP